MTYDVISISNRRPTEWYYLFSEYYKSLGNYQPKVYQPTHWGGLATKPKFLYQLIKQKVINTSHLVFTDCWDLVFAAEPDEIMEAYGFFNKPIVISAEANCFPPDLKNEFDKLPCDTKYKYLNSGFICGETEAVLTCLEGMDLPNLPDDYYDAEKGCNVHPNDQFEWMKMLFKFPELITLDNRQVLSQTLHGATIDEFDFSRTRIKNKLTGAYPCTFHFNGSSKDRLELRQPILSYLKLL